MTLAPWRFACDAPLGSACEVVAWSGEEALSEPFRYDVELRSPCADLELAAPIARAATLQLAAGVAVHGVVERFCFEGEAGEGFAYRAELVPRLSLLGLGCDSERFDALTVPEAVSAVCAAHGLASEDFRWELALRHARRRHVRCDHESALAFVTRLLAEGGIGWVFDHRSGRDVVVCRDTPPDGPPLVLADGEGGGPVPRVRAGRRVADGAEPVFELVGSLPALRAGSCVRLAAPARGAVERVVGAVRHVASADGTLRTVARALPAAATLASPRRSPAVDTSWPGAEEPARRPAVVLGGGRRASLDRARRLQPQAQWSKAEDVESGTAFRFEVPHGVDGHTAIRYGDANGERGGDEAGAVDVSGIVRVSTHHDSRLVMGDAEARVGGHASSVVLGRSSYLQAPLSAAAAAGLATPATVPLVHAETTSGADLVAVGGLAADATLGFQARAAAGVGTVSAGLVAFRASLRALRYQLEWRKGKVVRIAKHTQQRANQCIELALAEEKGPKRAATWVALCTGALAGVAAGAVEAWGVHAGDLRVVAAGGFGITAAMGATGAFLAWIKKSGVAFDWSGPMIRLDSGVFMKIGGPPLRTPGFREPDAAHISLKGECIRLQAGHGLLQVGPPPSGGAERVLFAADYFEHWKSTEVVADGTVSAMSTKTTKVAAETAEFEAGLPQLQQAAAKLKADIAKLRQTMKLEDAIDP